MKVSNRDNSKTQKRSSARQWIDQHWQWILGGVVLVVAVIAVTVLVVLPQKVYNDLMDGHLKAADYWTDTPQILSAGLGFDGIIGLPALDE